MADWSKPALASPYADFVTEVRARDTDLAVGFDPAVVTPTNFSTGTIRWRSAASKWEKWNGTTWGDLAATYEINISGTAANVSGIVAPANGGSGQSSYTIGDILYASGATALAKLAAVATGNVLLSGGAATAPTWGKVGLTTHVSGTLPVANGGTGVATLTGVAYGNGTGAITAATAAQLVAAIGTTAVTNATNAVNADTLDTYHASSFVLTVNGVAPTSGNVVVNTGVTSVNSNTGAITAEQIAAAATAGYGYTPANSAHTHSYYVSTNMTHGAVGSLCFAQTTPSQGEISYGAGGIIEGSRLKPSGWQASTNGLVTAGAPMSGTWRCLGVINNMSGSGGTYTAATLWQRIS